MHSMHGIHVHGFPNLFIIGFAQGANLISNVTSNLADSGVTIAAVVKHALDVGASEVEVTEAAEQAWMELLETNPESFFGNTDCTPGYYNNEGQPLNAGSRFGMAGYPFGPVAYFEYIEKWRNSCQFEGLEFRSSRTTA